MTPTDPILAAVEAKLRETITAWWQTPPRLDWAAGYAVEAHRRAVLDRRDAGERVRQIRDEYERDSVPPLFAVRDLLAALADESIARQQAEADRDTLVRARDRAVAKATDYADAAEQAERRGEAAQQRASRHSDRADAEEESWRLVKGERDVLAEELARVRAKASDLLDGELAHRSRDYGRGVAQATRVMLAALDGGEDG